MPRPRTTLYSHKCMPMRTSCMHHHHRTITPQAEPLRPEEDEHERQDELAEGYGITDFSYRLHRALGDEGEQEAALMARPRWVAFRFFAVVLAVFFLHFAVLEGGTHGAAAVGGVLLPICLVWWRFRWCDSGQFGCSGAWLCPGWVAVIWVWVVGGVAVVSVDAPPLTGGCQDRDSPLAALSGMHHCCFYTPAMISW